MLEDGVLCLSLPMLTPFMDMSLSGWGAHFQDCRHQGIVETGAGRPYQQSRNENSHECPVGIPGLVVQ